MDAQCAPANASDKAQRDHGAHRHMAQAVKWRPCCWPRCSSPVAQRRGGGRMLAPSLSTAPSRHVRSADPSEPAAHGNDDIGSKRMVPVFSLPLSV